MISSSFVKYICRCLTEKVTGPSLHIKTQNARSSQNVKSLKKAPEKRGSNKGTPTSELGDTAG